MRRVASEVESRESRGLVRMGTRLVASRKARLRALALESLEARTLLAVLPPIVHDPNAPLPIDLAKTASGLPGDNSTTSNESAPTIAIDPVNPQKLVAVWSRSDSSFTGDTKVIAEGAYSTDGGITWTGIGVEPVVLPDPVSSATPPARFAEVTDVSVAFDRSENFYVLSSQHATNDQTGALTLERYNFSGASPSGDQLGSEVIDQWDSRNATNPSPNAVLSLSLAVDNTVSSFTDGSWQVSNPNSGNVYIAMGLSTPNPASPTNFNNFTVRMFYSTDKGVTFSAPMTLGASAANNTNEHDIAPKISVSQGGGNTGIAPGLVSVVWDDFGTDAKATPNPLDDIRVRTFNPSTQTLGSIVVAARTTILGTQTLGTYPTTYPLQPAVSPHLGIGPAPVIASDNTLGNYSEYQGRLYIAYVGRTATNVTNTTNPTDNTDIYLVSSGDGGRTWSSSIQVNQDNSQLDGYSEGLGGQSGRPQFEPQVSVDPATGTLVVSYLDARDDAARARYATYVTTSITGGSSFAPDTFVNTPQVAFDTITRQNVTLGPIPDNQSSGNPNTETRYTFGTTQGLAVYNGRIYAAWSGDENGGANTKNRLDIRVAPMRYAVGPRIVSSTMGVASPFSVTVPPPGGSSQINTPDPVTGIPRVNGFVVTFDRNVDPSTFTAADVQVSYLAPGAAAAVLQGLTNVLITPQDSNSLGATTFLVTFNPLTAVGTYSYAIGPAISDRIRSVTTTTTNGHAMDQNANGVAGETTDAYATPRPLNGTPFQSSYDTTTLPLIIPGPHVISTRALDANGQPITPTNGENLALNGIVTGVQVTFDRDMRPSSFDGSDILGMIGPLGAIPGPFTVQQVGGSLRTFNILFPVAAPERLSGSYTLTLGPNINSIVNSDPSRTTGDPIDANQNAALDELRGGNASNGTTIFTASNATVTPIGLGQTIDVPIMIGTDFTIAAPVTLTLDISFPNDPALSATLVILDPNGNAANNIRIPLFSGVGSAGTKINFQNTIFDDNAITPIENGAAPFTSRYRLQTGLGALLSSLNGRSAKATYELEITNASTTPGDKGQLNSWSISMGQPVSQDGLGEPVADQTPVSFRIFVMDPSNAQSQNTWTAVGPASLGNGSGPGSAAGRVGGLAIDPSDASGNTVYAAGASGGVWKTTDFLTNDPNGPTWIPLTDFGPTNAINIGSIAVFPRNNDPRQSIIFAATGEGDTGSPGVGFLRSMDGGATWTLLDSLSNFESNGVTPLPINGASATSGKTRDHAFVGTNSFKVIVDPRLTPTGDVIVYAALSGSNGGIYRSVDTGRTWQLMKAGKATDVVLDPYSGPKDAFGNPVGNLQTVYAAFGNDTTANNGVWLSTNQGQVFSRLDGGLGLPLIQDAEGFFPKPIPVTNNTASPSGRSTGRIVLAKPVLAASTDPNANVQNQLYEGWLYALVAATDNTLDGLYLTKDYGANWTKVSLTSALPESGFNLTVAPTNDPGKTTLNITGTVSPQSNYDIVMAIDPSNPNIVYIGGKADYDTLPKMIRVDVTNMTDLYTFYQGNNNADGGLLRGNTTDPTTMKNAATPPPTVRGSLGTPTSSPYLNLIKNPLDPLGAPSSFYVANTASFNNSGFDAKWVPFDTFLGGSDDLHRILTFRDPLTGKTRLIVGDDHGVWTGVDQGNGQLIQNIGNNPVPTYSRNGNLQITQLYYGATQPSNLAAQVAGALLYGEAQDDGAPASSPNALATGDIRWGNTSGSIEGDGSGVATDQTGTGTQYAYQWPCCGGNITDFFQVNGVGRTSGLIQQSGTGQVPDPQWPYLSPAYTAAGIAMGNFAVNPVNGDQVIISSNAGRIFATNNQGLQWQVIGAPAFLDGTYAPALAFGAPDPNDPTGATNNFLYAGTVGGNIFVTFTGGGSPTTNNWINITNGDLAGNTAGVLRIIPSPIRGSHEAYAVTTNGVYHIAESNPNANVPAALKTWTRINGPVDALGNPTTSNLFGMNNHPFNDPNLGADTLTKYLTSLEVDWRYTIPDTTVIAGDPSPTHPILYVSGNSGVYRSIDGGQTWSLFPSIASNLEAAPRDGGYLPNVKVMDLALSIGNVDPTTGASVAKPGDPGFLLATTYGQGSFAIRIGPLVLPNSVALDTNLPAPSGSDSGKKDRQNNPIVTTPQPVFDGVSERSAFGNLVRITLYDLTDPKNPTIIGGYDPSKPSTDIAANQTNAAGKFAVSVNAGMFSSNGIKTIGIRATDQSGTVGGFQTFTMDLQANGQGQAQAPKTPTLALSPTSDSSGGRNVTNITTGQVTGVTDPNVTVSLFQVIGGVISESPLSTATTDANGNYVLPYGGPPNGPLAPGTYTFLVQAVNSFGPTNSSPLTITIDTQAPTLTPTLSLSPADDTGVVGDGITANNQPYMIGTADPNVIVDLLNSSNTVLVSTPTDANGNYSVQLPAPLPAGTYVLTARSRTFANNVGPTSAPFTLQILATGSGSGLNPSAPLLQPASDTGPLGDNITSARSPSFSISGVPSGSTVTLYRDGVPIVTLPNVAGGTVSVTDPGPLLDGRYVYAAQVSGGTGNVNFLTPGTTVSVVTVQGDYNGDGKADFSVFRRVSPGEADWYVAGGIVPPGSPPFGSGTLDVPFQGDLDGDGRTDLILYRPSTSTWYVQQSSKGFVQYSFGGPGDIPAVGDFDGVGHDELAVYRPSTSQWFVAGHGTVFDTFGGPLDVPVPLHNYYGAGKDVLAVFRGTTGQWFIAGQGAGISFGGGNNEDLPIPLFNYDGSGRDVLATFRPSTSQWFVAGLPSGISFGGTGDIPIAGDFDGVGFSELGVFRPSTTQWFVAGHGTAVTTFGASTDIPVASAYAYRALPGSVASLSTSSVKAMDFGGTALSLSSDSASTSAIKASSVVATPTVTPTSTVSTKRPNQVTSSPSHNLHDRALASLKRFHKKARTGPIVGG